MNDFGIHVATGAERKSIAQSLARAFDDDPVMAFLFDDSRSRMRRIELLFSAFLDGHYLRGGATYTDASNQGCAMWAAPGHAILSPLEILSQGHRMLRAFGTGVPKALGVLSKIEKVHPTEPHWYLGVLGTDPAVQGKGIGAAVLKPVLERCDAEGLPAYLESSKDLNVPYYQRFGFEVTGEIVVAKGGPTVWPMWREPRG